MDEHSRTTSVYRGQAHYALGGDWRQHFCQDGYLFCAHGDGGTDWENLPDYVSQVTKGGDVDAVQLDLTGMGIVWSTQILEGVDPAESDRLSSLRRVGRWTSDTSSFTFEVELAEAKAFNLSLYTTSLDHNSSIPLYGAPSLEYAEQFGREVQLSVTDLRGTQVFTVTQNATGVWATFPVVGDADHPIEVEVSCRLSNQLPTISAIAFDPFEDRRIFLEYDGQGNLAKVIQPTSDPEREVSTEYSYNADGTVSEVVQALRESGVLSDSRSTSMFYQDLAKNLTRVEDALNGSGAPMQMEYNLNGDMVRAIDQDQVATNYLYDYRHRLIGTQNDLGHSTAMVYDGRGLLSSARDARGFVTEFLYTPQRRLWKIINALGEVIEYSYLADGLLESITDASGTVTFAYNDLRIDKLNRNPKDLPHKCPNGKLKDSIWGHLYKLAETHARLVKLLWQYYSQCRDFPPVPPPIFEPYPVVNPRFIFVDITVPPNPIIIPPPKLPNPPNPWIVDLNMPPLINPPVVILPIGGPSAREVAAPITALGLLYLASQALRVIPARNMLP